MAELRKTFATNWFYPVAFTLLMLVGFLATSTRGLPRPAQGPTFEVALLADVFVTLPMLYWLCFRKRHGMAKLLLGVTAVVCSGLWLSGLIVPLAEQRVLPQLSWFRFVGLVIIVGFEVRLAALALRLMWRPQTKVAELEAQGVPPVVAKLMLLEARFWRWALSALRK